MGRERAAIKGLAVLALLLGTTNLRAQTDPEIGRYESLIKAERYEEARAALESYVSTHPQAWQALYQLGYVDFRLHRIRQSLTMLCKSLVLHPQFAESHKILAYDLNILSRQDLAIRELELAIRYDPQSAESHYELGRIYYERGSYLSAVQHLEKAKLLAPGFVRVYHNLGLAYWGVGDNVKATANFETGLRLNAQQSKPSAWPLIDYATYFNFQGEFAEARDMLLQAVKIDPTWDREFEELSKAYRGLGQVADAIETLKQAVALNPRKSEYHYVLAQLYRQMHRLTEAKEQLTEYERNRPPQ
ncbi:MAG TPA: tetratricopeptide repeat protein [Bryobacteraceae bacterium]|nr:tetratricopeptide repeat protein [Bryobacteraceae bacterium]